MAVYKINLYPAGLAKRANQSESIRNTALLALLGGVNALILGFFFLTAMTVKGQADVMEERTAALESRLANPGDAALRSVTNQARALLERRAARTVWTPALNQLRNNLPQELILERLEASVSTNGDVFSGFQLTGRLRSGKDVEPVMNCLDRLSASAAYRAYFERAKLDRVDNSQDVSRFVIACPLLRPSDSDSSGEASGG